MLIDTHTHVNFVAFRDDAQKIIQKTLDKNIQLIMVGSQYSTSERAVKIATAYETGVYAAIGIHPVHLIQADIEEEGQAFTTREESFNADLYQKLIDTTDKVVAIGEIGLDFHWFPREEVFDRQVMALKQQFNFAYENNLPVIIHCRKAHDDLYAVLAELVKDKPKKEFGVIHSYYGSYTRAMSYIDLGFLVSFNGIITYGTSDDKLISRLPIEKIMVETDCPYLTPEPLERTQRNEPVHVEYVAQKIASVKNISFEDVAQVTTTNAQRLFKI